MTIHWYLLPMVRDATNAQRGPKYFTWRGASGLTDPWNLIDYGLIDQCLLVSDISAADHTALSANSDVLAIPLNLDATLTSGAVTAAVNYLESIGAPATGWVTTALTYRQVLRVVAGYFLYLQRVTAITGQPITMTGGTLDLTLSAIPLAIRNAMQQAANDLNYNYAWVTGATTVRALLKGMADAWGAQPILLGMATL